MKRILIAIALLLFTVGTTPKAFAEGGIFPSGGGKKTVGQTFTINVVASGATFDSLQGVISISGPVDIVAFSPGGATWMPGKTPSNGGQFVGLTSPTDSVTVATIKLRGKSPGSGSVTVSNAKLASNMSYVGTGGGAAGFTIERAPSLPKAVEVSSTSHPDQNTAYEETKVVLSWAKESKVTGFSYIWDQIADTTPASKVTNAETTLTMENQPVGTYYFHIKAQNGDGWGPVTHYKVSIKEPDAKVNEALSKPTVLSVTKMVDFVNDIEAGSLSGISIKGQTEPNYTANIKLDPSPTLPEGKTLQVKSDETGAYELILDYPVKAGFYKLTVQGQLEKVLTPLSDTTLFEISLAKGGSINILTDKDRLPPPTVKEAAKKWYQDGQAIIAIYILAALILLALLITMTVIIIKKRKQKKIDYKKKALKIEEMEEEKTDELKNRRTKEPIETEEPEKMEKDELKTEEPKDKKTNNS